MVDPRELFDPLYAKPSGEVASAPTRWTLRELYRLIRRFYRQPVGWVALAISTLVMIYGGGGLMFWYHSVYLGEGGPAINPWLHWVVDSTAGFIALTPVLAVIVPIATQLAWRHPGPADRPGGLRTAYYAMAGGTLFALATTPGPVLHDNYVGRGTWLADQITGWWGDGRSLPPAHHLTPPVSMSLQLAFGLPVYIMLMWLSLITVRSLLHGWRAATRP